MLERVWRKGNPLTLLVGMQTSTATMENSVEIPLKIGNRTALWPSNCTAGHTHGGNQNWKKHIYPSVDRSTVYNSQDMEATYMSISRRMDKKAVVHVYTQWSIAATAKSLQSCPTLCDPIDGSPPGSPVPGILQARTLEWVAISFSNGVLLSH